VLLDSYFPKQGSWDNEFVRRYPRMPFSVPVKFHHLRAGRTWTSTGISLDLSEGGFGALVNGKLSPDETLEVELPISNNNLRLIAIVRYCSDFGCGLEFLGLTAEERSMIAEITTQGEQAHTREIARLMR